MPYAQDNSSESEIELTVNVNHAVMSDSDEPVTIKKVTAKSGKSKKSKVVEEDVEQASSEVVKGSKSKKSKVVVEDEDQVKANKSKKSKVIVLDVDADVDTVLSNPPFDGTVTKSKKSKVVVQDASASADAGSNTESVKVSKSKKVKAVEDTVPVKVSKSKKSKVLEEVEAEVEVEAEANTNTNVDESTVVSSTVKKSRSKKVATEGEEKVKKPPTAYQEFAKVERARLKAEDATLTFGQLSKLIGANWKVSEQNVSAKGG